MLHIGIFMASDTGEWHPQSTYIPRVPQCLSPCPNWAPNPSPASEFVPARNQHLPAVEGVGGPNPDDWRKSLALSQGGGYKIIWDDSPLCYGWVALRTGRKSLDDHGLGLQIQSSEWMQDNILLEKWLLILKLCVAITWVLFLANLLLLIHNNIL